MSENANTNAFAGDLLSNLAANPELLKNAMQMASALASSGMLSGLFGGAPSQESAAPEAAAPKSGASAPSGSLADLLAGLMGQGGSAAASPSTEKSRGAAFPPSPAEEKKESAVFAEHGQERKHSPAPNHNDRIHLLQSICPFLPDEKREKVQFLIKLLGLLSAAEQMGLGKLF